MPRTGANVIRLEQFGGLRRDLPRPQVNDCTDCLNVHTASGQIQVRPGYVGFYGNVSSAADESSDALLTQAHIYARDYVLLWWKNPSDPEPPQWDIGKYQIWDARNVDVETHNEDDPILVPVGDLRRPSVVSFADRIYIICGDPAYSRKVYRVGDIWHHERIGILAPNVAPALTEEPGGNYNEFDEIAYYYTYWNANAGVESGPSPPEMVTIDEFTFKRAVGITLTATDDEQVTHIRLYRKYINVAGHKDQTWYYVMDIEITADPLWLFERGDPPAPGEPGDESDRSTEGALNFVVDVPPPSHVACVHQQRMWYVNGIGSHLLRFSERGRPEQSNPVLYYAVGDSRDHITAMRSAFGRLIIFKVNSIWSISGSSTQSWTVNLLAEGCGCIAPNTITPIGNNLYFANQKGIYRIGAGGVEYLSHSLGPLGDWFDPAASAWFDWSGCHDELNHLYLVCGKRPDFVDGRIIAFDYIRRNWSIWQTPFRVISDLSGISGPVWNGWAQSNDGVAKISGKLNTDDGNSIPWSWDSPWSDLGTHRHKKFYYFTGNWEAENPNGDTITAEVTVRGQSPIQAISADTNEQGATGKLSSSGKLAKFALSGDSTTRTQVTSLELDVEPLGYR